MIGKNGEELTHMNIYIPRKMMVEFDNLIDTTRSAGVRDLVKQYIADSTEQVDEDEVGILPASTPHDEIIEELNHIGYSSTEIEVAVKDIAKHLKDISDTLGAIYNDKL